MEIIYRANDGKEFFNEKDCRAHENRNMPKMWNCDGTKTDDFDCAKYIYFESEEQVESFLYSQEFQCDFGEYMGIDIRVKGLYVWNEYHKEYDWICLDDLKGMLEILRQADKDTYNKLF